MLAFAASPAWAAGASPELPKDSLYRLASNWQDQAGKDGRLERFRGSPVLITMAYTRCKYSCPLIFEKLRKIEGELSGVSGLRIVVASFDAKHDSPEAFRAFLKEKGLEGNDRWSMLSGKKQPSAVRELAAALDINFREEAGGEFTHSNVISLLDKEGRIVKVLNGLAGDHGPLVKAAKELR